MKFCTTACGVVLLCGFSLAQDKKAPAPESVTVPAVIDHDRVVINAEVTLPDGTTQRVHAWIDNGNPDLYLSRRLAALLGLAVSCNNNGQECSSAPPREITIGGMAIPLAGIKEAKIP